MTAFVQFSPVYQERVWGGRSLETELGRTLPTGRPIGESWEIVDRPEAQSVVRGGPLAGMKLRQLIAENATEMMGAGWPGGRAFPLLIKWLDCRERLSLQVHPPAAVAARLGGEPKTENWYVARAEPGAAVLAGLKPGVDVARFRAALLDGTAESLVSRHETKAGDSVLIHSGVMHAIDGGNLILEIQQNSDTTYRVYDWGRVGLDGKPRALHVEQSLACLEANTAGVPHLVRAAGSTKTLAECAEFRIVRHRLDRGEKVGFKPREQPRVFSVVEGEIATGDGLLQRGDNVLLPCAGSFAGTAVGPAVVLVTDNFAEGRS